MSTTQLYVELIIIGLEGSVGLALAFISFFGINKFEKIITYFNSFPATIVLLGFLYIFGLLLDRFADVIFQKWEDKFRGLSGVQTKSVLVLLKNQDHIKFLENTRNRARILRASTIITLFTTVMAVICFSVQPFNDSFKAVIFSLLLGSFLFFVSLISYRKMLRKYYNRVRVIELETKV